MTTTTMMMKIMMSKNMGAVMRLIMRRRRRMMMTIKFRLFFPVLNSAPPIPAGIQSFHWNKNGIKQTKVEILIYLSQFSRLCRYIHFSLSLPFLHNVYSSTLPLKFNFK